MNLKLNILIFSVFHSKYSEKLNTDIHDKTILKLYQLNIPHKIVEGYYKGTKELSILVPIEYRHIVISNCWANDQECYLESTSDRSTYLHYDHINPAMKSEFIGYLTAVPQEQALAQSNYTFDPETNQYFITLSERG